MKVVYIGNSIEQELCNKGLINFDAGTKWQINFYNSLKDKLDITVISKLQIPFFPKSKFLTLPTKEIEKYSEQGTIYFKYINIMLIRELIIFFQTIYYIIKLIIINRKEKIKFIQFNLNLENSIPLFIFQKLKLIDYIPLVLDLYPISEKKEKDFRTYFKGFTFYFQSYILKNSISAMVINKNIVEDYELKNYIIIEGGVSEEDIRNSSMIDKEKDENEIKKIVYTGRIDYINGIDFLLESIKKIKNENVEFHFYGNGELLPLLENEAINDKRIKYKGLKPNSEILKIQKNSDFLIIPRKKSLAEVRYTFPSKLFEYLLSETPIISTNLDCLTSDFKEYMNIIDTESSDIFAQELDKILNMDYSYFKEKSKSGKKIIIEDKNWEKVSNRIANFIGRI